MSVIIQGIEVPEGCYDCRMLEGTTYDGLCHAADKWLDDDSFLWYQFPEGDIDDNKPINCPLVEVPPHGRLIDAYALDDAFTNLRWTTGDYKTGELAHWGDRKDWCLKGQEVDALIKSAPTIIPAEDGE
jgi:hypothetical protein